MNTAGILAEDARRREARAAAEGGYDPVEGRGCCGPRELVDTPVEGLPRAFVPRAMTADPSYGSVRHDTAGWRRLRCRHDFEYWCAACVRIKHKTLGHDVPFVLNAPQRRVAAMLEADRRAGRPMRMIMLKARQWGGSTLVQMYMAWIQSCVRRNWHSLICAHVKDTAASIRGMYTKMLAAYPSELWDGDEPPRFRPFERSINVREIAGRGCRVTIGSAENQEAVRGSDYSMAHLSETAFWPATPRNSPADFIRAVCGAIALIPDSLIVMESTANGVGSYFHSEWLRCKAGDGDKHAVFVAWHEIEIYRLQPPDPEGLAASMNAYERMLWDAGLCLDQIYWYRRKRAEYADAAQMMAEFPTTDTEAFLNTGRGVFAPEAVERLRADCTVEPRRGETDGHRFRDDSLGGLRMWRDAEEGARYVAAVDIGGLVGVGLVGDSRDAARTAAGGATRGGGAMARPHRSRPARAPRREHSPPLQPRADDNRKQHAGDGGRGRPEPVRALAACRTLRQPVPPRRFRHSHGAADGAHRFPHQPGYEGACGGGADSGRARRFLHRARPRGVQRAAHV